MSVRDGGVDFVTTFYEGGSHHACSTPRTTSNLSLLTDVMRLNVYLIDSFVKRQKDEENNVSSVEQNLISLIRFFDSGISENERWDTID